MKRLKIIALGLLAGVAVALPPPAQGAAGIKGSPHDFSDQTNFFVNGTNWVPNNNLCEVCHVVHTAAYSSQTYGPLWNHTVTVGKQYTPFTSPNLSVDGYPNGAQPGYASLACLSCHDGSIAINEQGGKTTPTGGTAVNIPSWAQIAVNGTDLSGCHPIGISYDIVAGNDGYLNPVTAALTDAGTDTKTIKQEMLFQEAGGSDMLECASCHDIHQQKGASATAKDSLKIGSDGVISTLCLTCHIK